MIRSWREQQGMTQAELAAALDVRTQTISEWETGVRVVRMGRVLALALERLADMRQDDDDSNGNETHGTD